MIRFYVKSAIATFSKRRLRAWLTILGIFIGIAAIVSLISLGQGLKTAVGAQFSALGTDRIIIQAKSLSFGPPGQGTVAKLTTDDFDRVERVAGVETAAQRLLKSAEVEFNDLTDFTFVGSMPANQDGQKLIEEMFRLRAAHGRLLQQGDQARIVVGSNYAEGDQFEQALRVGDRLTINNRAFELVGILEKSGQPQVDNTVLMPEESMRDLYDAEDEVSAIIVQSLPGQEPEDVGERISRALRQFRDVEKNREDFTVQTSGQLLETLGTVLNIVTAVLAGIAGIALLVGGIGIMNTMYTSVLERTSEIGLMKAVGASNKNILFLFVIESGFLGLVGGAIGIVLGAALSLGVQIIATQVLGPGLIQAAFPWYLIVGALVFSFVIGSLAGTLPAVQASRLNPVDAMRR